MMSDRKRHHSDALDAFAPLVRAWFVERYGTPTAVQTAAWPPIHAGEHVLVTAPTGSGKTLTAFLAAVNALVSGRWPLGELSVLYVSPLKALNNDIQRNLLGPLGELRELANRRGETFPEIEVATRSGDTPGRERQRMVRRPPEILITTPESLNIILSAPRARAILRTVKTVILDEIHAVLDSKRGTHLITAVERTSLLAGEFQRIAVSATVRPLDLVARFVGGYAAEGLSPVGTVAPGFDERPVTIVRAPDTKEIELTVDFPETDVEPEPGETAGLWPHLVRELRTIIDRNRSTLIFVTTRRHAEKLALLINEGLEAPIAYSHHGSLSHELRHFVEQTLKEGRLRAIVATNTLELGIDVGSLDEIVMVRTPFSVSSTLQRLGRAGHRVGETSRGTLFPIFGKDMVDAAAMTGAVLERDIEDVRPVVAPLDVLAQVVVSMTAMERWHVDRLYDAVRAAWPYRALERRLFDLVVEMLAGRYAETRIRELRPRISFDRVSGVISAREGATALLYQSGGTIPDRGYYGLRMDGNRKVGELDEEFVWERRVGETFVFGSQTWTITSITDRDVFVVPAAPGAQAIPFWRAEARGRDAHYSRRLLSFLESCEEAIGAGRIERFLGELPWLSPVARDRLVDVLEGQRAATGTPLPHLHHVVAENVLGAPRARADEQTQEIVVHTGRGGRVNEPLAIVLAALWEREYGYPLEVFADNDCLVLLLPAEFAVDQAFSPQVCRQLARSGAVEDLLRERLERSGRFGARFRENAGRALLLPRGGFTRRMPLWLNRLRSKKLLTSTAALPDFPILLETWRTCLHDEFDLPALRELLEGIASFEIVVSACETASPSPFASEVVWQQVNLHMYQDDSLPSGDRSSLADELIREAVHTDALRPRMPRVVIDYVVGRLTRVSPGYAPDGPEEINDWITERLALGTDEMRTLREAVIRDHADNAWSPGEIPGRYLWVVSEHRALFASRNRIASLFALYPGATAVEPRLDERWWEPPPPGAPGRPLVDTMPDDGRTTPPAEDALLELLRVAGPIPVVEARSRFGIVEGIWDQAIAELHRRQLVVIGELVEDDSREMLCDAETLEFMLRVHRGRSRPSFEPVPARALVPLWAETTMLAAGRDDPDALVDVLDLLFGYSAPAGSWEADILPARLGTYHPLWLDGLFSEHDLVWLGCGRERIRFALGSDVGLYRFDPPVDDPDTSESPNDAASNVVRLLHAEGAMDFASLRDRTGIESEVLTAAVWDAAWRCDVSNDRFQSVRKGVETRFTASPARPPAATNRRWPGRGARAHREWRATRPVSGTWFALAAPQELDALTRSEEARERARTLLRRYGIVFRDLVIREGAPFSWGSIFRALRLMELAGEVVSGVFVDGVATPQFALRSTLPLLERIERSSRVVWMSAVDPASPCGLGLGGCYGELPSRIASNHLVFRGADLVLVGRRNGRELDIRVSPDDPDVPDLFAPLRNLVTRQWGALSRVVVETINGEPVRESAFAPALRALGFRDEYRSYVLNAPYR